MAMEQGRVTEFEGKSLDQIQIEPEGRAVEILSQTDGLKETSSGEPSTIHPDAPHGSGSAPSERCFGGEYEGAEVIEDDTGSAGTGVEIWLVM
uniref:Uncharacterized protein n=1 Tax=Knipowitschia caucasica TaxID=637954 RepID=A0AAV2LG68_KNICA